MAVKHIYKGIVERFTIPYNDSTLTNIVLNCGENKTVVLGEEFRVHIGKEMTIKIKD